MSAAGDHATDSPIDHRADHQADHPASSRSDPWAELRRHTPARIALGRSGVSLPTRQLLAFGAAHAQARDAVHTPLDVDALLAELVTDGWSCLRLQSQATDRLAYLARPDWGRSLDNESRANLVDGRDAAIPDVVFVVSDGLSSFAVQQHAAPLLHAVKSLLQHRKLAPLIIATQARVALADDIGEILKARIAVSLIGERPGLSAADSLSAYLTYMPRVGRTDAERNCISNIRPGGLSFKLAGLQIAALIDAMLHAQISGVALRFDPSKVLSAI